MAKNDREQTKERNSYIFKSIVIVLLVIIIILLLLNGCGALELTNKGEYTGDFDIFEITLKGTCPVCEKCKKCEVTKPASSEVKDSDDNKNDDNEDFEPKLDEDRVVVYDKVQEWEPENTVSNIFKHSSTEILSGKIAPGSNNTYKFIVRNLNEFTVKYKIIFKETNTKNINMKYRLKLESTYLAGSDTQWVGKDSLDQAFKNLSQKSMNTYYLEWKWFDNDEYDTPIGIDESSVYSLSIKVEAEEV